MSLIPNGLIVAGHRRRFLVDIDGGARLSCVTKGRKLTPACGDRVTVALQGDEGVIETLAERASLFWRADGFREKVIAANVDQVIGVVAVDPAFSEELVNRWIVASESNGCRFVLVLNKIDLPRADEVRAQLALYARLGYEVISLCAKRDVSPLKPLLAGHRSVLVGQSGMGKSTLINALVPDAAARIGEISVALGTGKHTTTHSELYRLDAQSWLVDSPGLQEFGLHHLTPGQIEEGFVEFRELRGQCKFRDCRHEREPGCALHRAVADGRIVSKRADYLCRFKNEIAPK